LHSSQYVNLQSSSMLTAFATPSVERPTLVDICPQALGLAQDASRHLSQNVPVQLCGNVAPNEHHQRFGAFDIALLASGHDGQPLDPLNVPSLPSFIRRQMVSTESPYASATAASVPQRLPSSAIPTNLNSSGGLPCLADRRSHDFNSAFPLRAPVFRRNLGCANRLEFRIPHPPKQLPALSRR